MKQQPSGKKVVSGPTVLDIAQRQRELRGEQPLTEMPECNNEEAHKSQKEDQEDYLKEHTLARHLETICPTELAETCPPNWSQELFNKFLNPTQVCSLCGTSWKEGEDRHTIKECVDKGYIDLRVKIGPKVMDMLYDMRVSCFAKNSWIACPVEQAYYNEIAEHHWSFVAFPPGQSYVKYPKGFKISVTFERSDNTLILDGRPHGEIGCIRPMLEIEDLDKGKVILKFFMGEMTEVVWIPVFDLDEIENRIELFWARISKDAEKVFQYEFYRL